MKKQAKSKSAVRGFTDYLAKRQIEIPLKIIGFILAGYFMRLPKFQHFIFISNQRGDGRFEKSFWDLTFLFFYVCVFTAVRASVMDYVLMPLARISGTPKKKHLRFTEQAYAVIYYSIAFSYGIYVMKDSPWWFDSTYFWRDYPVTDYTKAFKYYYLLQFAYWIQQLFVLQIEAPRSDYKELVMHHINTLLLISLSYCCNFTRVGNAVFVCMDLPDAWFALSKCLNYCLPGIICNTTFAITFVSWLYTRVYIYGYIIWSTWVETELYVPQFKLDPMNGFWFPHFAKYIIWGLMMGLYFLILFWTALMIKVILKILISSDDVKDVRSDEEDEVEDIVEKVESDHIQPKSVIKDLKQA